MKAVLNKFSSFFLQGGLKDTVSRFSVSVLCALTLFIVSVATNMNFILSGELLLRLISCVVVGYFWFGGMRLVAESMDWTRTKEMTRAFLVYVPFAALMALAEDFGQYLLFIIPALLLFLMVSPYAATRYKNEDDLSFWLFNRYLWVGVLLSFLAIIVMTGGLQAAFMSVEALFKVNLPHKWMSNIWSFSAFLVGPVYALSLVPKQFSYADENECEKTPGLMFMLNWILAPLILIYFLILYAYFTKLLIIQELPLGVLAYMVTGFAGVGIATYLIGWPVKEKTGALMQKFYKYFFPALIIPVILQFMAIGERIHTFGVTEQRYLVALSAVWLAVLVFLFTWRKNTSIKLMPCVLMGLLVLASFGPWGAVGLSGHSQQSRLEQLLVKHEILQDGKVAKTENDIPFEDRKSISSKLEYLKKSKRHSKLREWFPDKDDGEWKQFSVYDMTKEMGFEYVSHYMRGPSDDRFNFYSNDNDKKLLPVGGYDFVTHYIYASARGDDNDVVLSYQKIDADADKKTPQISWNLNKSNTLTVSVEGRGDVVFDLAELVEAQRAGKEGDNERKMIAEKLGKGMKIRLVFSNLSGKMEDGSPVVENVSFVILLDL